MKGIERIDACGNEQYSRNLYHVLIAVLGYERRATYISERIGRNATKRIAIGFEHTHELWYSKNQRWFAREGFRVESCSDSSYGRLVQSEIEEAEKKHRGVEDLRICVDISSISRFRMAEIVDAISALRTTRAVAVDFLYARAMFSKPPEDGFHARSIGPVSPRFRGSVRNINLPRSAVIGVGYEYELAAGVVERLETSDVWTFQPASADERYDELADTANQFLWLVVPRERRLRYRVERPLDVLINLESLVSGLARVSTPVLVPFGPKIFTLCCLCVGMIHNRNVEVWRVATSPSVVPMDRRADGLVVGLTVRFDGGDDRAAVPGTVSRQSNLRS